MRSENVDRLCRFIHLLVKWYCNAGMPVGRTFAAVHCKERGGCLHI